MSVYPIEGLMNTAMNSIKEMVDVNTIIGEPIQTNNNVVIIPISKVNFGFAAGGSEFKGKMQGNPKEMNNIQNDTRMPFGGGSGAGVSISPIAFIVVQQTGVKLLPIEHSSSLDKLLDLVPDLIDKLNAMIDSQIKKIQKPSNNENYSNNNQTSRQVATPESTTTNININTEPKKYDVEYDETLDM